MKSVLLVLFFLPSISQGAIYGFCFSRSVSLDRAINHLEGVRSPRDSFHKRTSLHCLEVSGNPKMYELYRKYLSTKFRVLRTYKGSNAEVTSSTQVRRGMCKIKIIKTGGVNSSRDVVKAGRKQDLSRSESNKEVNSVSNMVLSYGRTASLRVNDDSIEVTCSKSGGGFQMGFSLQGKNSSLSSSAWVASGGKLDLGQIVNDLNEKSRSASIGDGLSYQKDKSKSVYNYSLEVR